MFIDSFDSI